MAVAPLRADAAVLTVGIADDCDAVVELTAGDLGELSDVSTVSGDDRAWSTLLGWLYLDVVGFHMHMR